MKNRALYAVAILTIALSACTPEKNAASGGPTTSEAQATVTVPSTIRIPKYTIAPVPAEITGPAKNLPGLHVGAWNNAQDHVLIVEDVRRAGDKTVFSGKYAYAAYAAWGVNAPGDSLIYGEVLGNKAMFTRTLREVVEHYTYTIGPDGSLSGEVKVIRTSNNQPTGSSSSRMKRVVAQAN